MAQKYILELQDNGDIQILNAEDEFILVDAEEIQNVIWSRMEFAMTKRILCDDDRIATEMKVGSNLTVLCENYLGEKYDLISTMHDTLIRLAYGTINETIIEELSGEQVNETRNEDEMLIQEFNDRLLQV